ncbi:Clp protease N-terminal domain-containing protein [Streptomyces sp. NPDC048590]|uniref:Clp protease N-terminal domain-containing protein n=1 Tax=Streptomyces sp. NPDC048590 TaxID=3365574 RepID=UPI00371E753E
MQFRTEKLPEQVPQSYPAAGEKLSAAMIAVTAAARRRAVRDGDRLVDTAHLLHSLIEADSEVREAFGGGPEVARVLGYLVQRSIGYGLRWQRTQEGGGAPAVRGSAGEGWSPAAGAAMDRATDAARLRGATHADGLDLLVALAADPDSRAVEVLRRAGVAVPLPAARAAVRAEADAQG